MLVLASAITGLSNLVYSMDETLQSQVLGSLGDINVRVLTILQE